MYVPRRQSQAARPRLVLLGAAYQCLHFRFYEIIRNTINTGKNKMRGDCGCREEGASLGQAQDEARSGGGAIRKNRERRRNVHSSLSHSHGFNCCQINTATITRAIKSQRLLPKASLSGPFPFPFHAPPPPPRVTDDHSGGNHRLSQQAVR